MPAAQSPSEMLGKTVLVTGATSGLGLATAEALAARGARIILGARSPGRGEAARVRLLGAAGNGEVHVVAGDLSSRAATLAMIDEVLRSFEPQAVVVVSAREGATAARRYGDLMPQRSRDRAPRLRFNAWRNGVAPPGRIHDLN